MENFGEPWTVFFEPRAHFSCCTSLVDVRKGKFEILELTRSLHLTMQICSILSTLYENIEEFLHVFHDRVGDLQKCTWESENTSLKWRISSEGAPRISASWTLLEESLDVEIAHLIFPYRFPRFPLHYTRTPKFIRVTRHGQERVHVLA